MRNTLCRSETPESGKTVRNSMHILLLLLLLLLPLILLLLLLLLLLLFFFLLWRCDPTRVMASFLRFLDHTQRRTTFGRTPLDE